MTTTIAESALDLDNPKPGMYPRVPSTEYHGKIDAASCSRLKNLYRKSPAHCKFKIDNPPKQTPAMKLGAILHTSVLEPDLFSSLYVVQPDFGDCRRTENKTRRDAWLAETRGKEPIEPDMAESVRGMTAALRSHKQARELICSPGYSEASFLWHDPETGILVKARTDRYLFTPRIIDIKTTSDASEWGFTRQICSLLYYMQAAMYLDGVGYVTGDIGADFKFIAVESQPPYGVNIFPATRQMLMEGATKYRKLLDTYAECHKSGNWPAYSEQEIEIKMPSYELTEPELTLDGESLN